MKVCGIISEYNPFHNGHKFQIDKTRDITRSSVFVAVMSGNFTQRGEAAAIDKWNRAKSALSCGINLVIELPVLYSVSSAEIFSFGGVSLLNSLNVIDYISFGSESGDIISLQKIAEVLSTETEDYKAKLKEELDKGLPFHKSRENALSDLLDENLLREMSNPNNILGIEYMKSLIRLNSKIKPVTIKRIGAGFNQLNITENYSSASGIRKVLYDNQSIDLIKNNMPEKAFNMLNDLKRRGYSFTDMDKIIPYIRYKLYMNCNGIKNIPEVIEGLDRKIIKEIDKNSFDELVMAVKSKRYTYTRIARILTQYFIGFENYDIKAMRKKPCPYARILGADEKGRKLIRLIKEKSSIPIINKLPGKLDDVLDLEVKSTKAYSLINKNISPIDDYLKKPIIY
ncbi:MAG: nucleotidyltransferase [Clostridiaceae bacterium]